MTKKMSRLLLSTWLIIASTWSASCCYAQQPDLPASEVASENDSEIIKPQPTKTQPEEKFTIHGSPTQAEIDWMESLHDRVSDTVFRSAFWFDGFFTDEDDARERPDVKARIRLGWEPKARDLVRIR